VRRSPFLEKLADEVQYRRRERKLSQEKLADAAGVHLNTVKTVEWAASDSQILTLFGIAAGLNIRLSELIAGAERRSELSVAQPKLR
jgi:transcriptional regulator with XRE-family HTH domain